MLEIGSVVGGTYKILSEIGHGGMSVVYMAINEKVNKTWAVKEVRKDGKVDFNTVKQGLLAEIDTLKKLKHEYLPSIVDVIEDKDSFIIVMDYIEGRSLDKEIAENGAQPEEMVVEWAKQLCGVLGYLHSQTPPIVYRDMKPANVMLKPNGSITVIDFGTAKNYEISLGETTGIGTIGYAAPEQYIGSGMGRTDARTDIYCLGMTLYHMLTNVDPCKNLISDKSIRNVNPALSRGLDTIIQKCIQHNPADRYQSCAELMYDLENYESLEPVFKKRQKRKFTGFVAMVALSLVFAATGIGLNVAAVQKATDTYESKIDEAAKSTDYDTKLKLYEECILIPDKAGEKDAYLGLIQTFKEDDSEFSLEEAKLLEKLIKNNRNELIKNSEAYTEICFETGKLFWYYYNYGDNQITKSKSSVEWFQDALNNAPEDYENKNMATVYANIGKFYGEIITAVTEGEDVGMYRPLFDNLVNLMDTVASDETEREIVRLELIEMTRSAMHQYATKFKNDGVTYQEITALYDKVERIVGSIDTTTEKTDEKKQTATMLLDDTVRAIEAAYGTAKGGDEQ